MNDHQATESFAKEYFEQAKTFTLRSKELREEQLRSES